MIILYEYDGRFETVRTVGEVWDTWETTHHFLVASSSSPLLGDDEDETEQDVDANQDPEEEDDDERFAELVVPGWRRIPWPFPGRASVCSHKWKYTPGIFRMYVDCELCGAKQEEVEGTRES